MTCGRCGSAIEGGNTFCTTCGAPFDGAPLGDARGGQGKPFDAPAGALKASESAAPAPKAAIAAKTEKAAARVVPVSVDPPPCANCGAANPAGKKFCTRCGARVATGPAGSVVAAVVAEPSALPPAAQYASATGETGAVPLFSRTVRQPADVLSRNWLAWINRETAVWALILVAAIVSRYLFLGDRPVHHDESIHADSSYDLYRLHGYKYDPGYHGPLLYHFNALAYFLFGQSDFTARVVPSFLGVLLVMSPVFFRDFLGRSGALIAALFFLTEGSILYYSRFLRDTVYLELANVVMTLSLFRWMREKRDVWLWVGAVALAVSFCTMEATYLTIAIFGGFMALYGIYECFVKKRRSFPAWVAEFRASMKADRAHIVGPRTEWIEPFRDPVSLAILGTVIAALGLFVLIVRGPDFLLAYVALLAGVAACITFGAAGITGTAAAIVLYFKGWHATGPDVSMGTAMMAAVLVAMGIGAAYLLLFFYFCRPKAVVQGSFLFTIIYVVLFSTCFTNLKGLSDGVTDSLTYWQTQHGVERGSQPPYLYLYIMLAYDLPILVFGFVAAFHYVDKRQALAKWFIFWTAASFFVYSYAGERMPWLVMHVTVPGILLISLYLGKMVDWAGRPWRQRGAIAAVVGSTFLFLHGAWDFTFRRPVDNRDLLIQVQTSNDVRWVTEDVEEISYQHSGEKREMPFLAAGAANWPFPWYFRDHKKFGYAEVVVPGNINEDGPIVMIVPWTDLERIKGVVGEKYTIQRYRERLWWDPDFKTVLPGWTSTRSISEMPAVFLGAKWWTLDVKKVWEYWMFREMFSGLGSEDMIVLKRKEFPHKFD